MSVCEINVARMAERAHADFLTVTELADTLVRREDISFREAHQLVSASVKAMQGKYSAAGMVESTMASAPGLLGRELKSSREELLEALDPVHFVNIRRIPGGPAPEIVIAALKQAEAQIVQTRAWVQEKSSMLAAYPERIREASNQLLEE